MLEISKEKNALPLQAAKLFKRILNNKRPTKTLQISRKKNPLPLQAKRTQTELTRLLFPIEIPLAPACFPYYWVTELDCRSLTRMLW